MNRLLNTLLFFGFIVFPGIGEAETYPRDDLWGGGEWRLEVILNAKRDEYGQATLLHESGFIVFGPVPVLGRTHQSIANSYKNYDRNPLFVGGDTPTGTYEAWVRSTEERNSEDQIYSQVRSQATGLLSYGSSGLLVLKPESGQALLAKDNGRDGLLAHAGDLGKNHGLRATAGCLRLYPGDMQKLVSFIAHYRSTITAEISIGTVTIALPPPYARDEPDTAAVDPPPLLEFSDPWKDKWTNDMWDALLETDQSIEEGGLFSALVDQGYYNDSRLEDMAAQGRDAERAAQYGGFDIAPEIENRSGNTSGSSNGESGSVEGGQATCPESTGYISADGTIVVVGHPECLD